MNGWQERYGGWEGGVAELAELAERLENEVFPSARDEGNPPNVRLIRNYVTLGVMSRGERRGKEAIFGLRHLAEFLVARLLVREGWPLPKLAELVRSSSDDRLYELLPPLKVTKAQQLLLGYRGAKGQARAAPGPSVSMLDTVFDSAKLRGDLLALGNATGAPAISHSVTIELTPWCRLLVDGAALKRMDAAAMDRVADAVRGALARAKLMKGEGR